VHAGKKGGWQRKSLEKKFRGSKGKTRHALERGVARKEARSNGPGKGGKQSLARSRWKLGGNSSPKKAEKQLSEF